ncbi:hypothetical protein HD597_003532 [Nonomuraea thailandensis]|uniref:Uncharacterized protein n=1 Tax=Nonomuraea thailandensis TaxID=1188745 RepID=A0A9X2K0Q1_9ACTN|nr:hypothetical protein [Nonomuraea thailandensis]MCP2356512.1 hypothetical protein [Nonomuraea thailandensis]
MPYSIVRATQFFEYVDDVLSWTGDEHTVRLPPALVQPMAAADVAQGDPRTVVTDNDAGMFAAASGFALVAKDGARIAGTTYRDWLARSPLSNPY